MPVDASEAAGPASPASASGTPSEAPPTVPFFKKKKKGSSSSSSSAKGKGKGGDGVENAVLRSNTETAPSSSSSSSALKRRTREDDGVEQGRDDDDDDAADQGPSVVRLSKKQEYNPLRQGTSAAFNKRRRRGQHGVNDEDDDEDDDDYYGTTSNSSTRVGVQFSDRPSSRRARSPSPRGGGGKEEGDDGRVLSGNAALAKAGEAVDDDDGDPASRGLYKGAAAYQSKLPAGSKVYTEGIKAPSASIRTITLVDYQPDVCKDYKETGFCGFGDSCKFLHDRGDYLHGWQLDNQFLSDQAGNMAAGAAAAAAAAQTVEEELPFACLICRNPFTDPIVTRCGHYFDSKCAIKRFAKTPKCFACGASTGGIFNKATKILERKEKNQRARIEAREREEGKDDYGEGGVEIEGLAEEQ